MLRDFSDSAKQKLLQYVKEVAASPGWDKVKDWFGDIGLTVQGWFGKLDIQKYVNDVDSYHKKVLDKNDTTSAQIETIFSNVQAVDTKYMGIVSQQVTCGNSITRLIKDLTETISPDGGNMNIARMKGLLDADVEDIKNAKTAVDRTVEEEMLGTDAAGCMNSEDPVNLSTGNFIYDHEDLKVGGEIPLSFHRYYNSKDSRTGVLGSCFLHNYETALEKEENGNVAVRLSDGQLSHYERNEKGGYSGKSIASGILEETEEGYLLVHPRQERITFDKEGRMLRKEDRNGKGITFTYDGQKRLAEAAADNGSRLTYSYNGEGLLEKVTDHTGRSVQLSYRDGRLEKAVASGAEYTYAYGENERITEVENARRVTAVRNTYDRRYRVTHQEFPDGGTMEFSYDDEARRVTLTERNGSRIVHVHDDRYRNTETIYEDGTRERYLYNDRNQCISRTDRMGRTTRMAYDNRGNLTQRVDAAKRRVNYTYDANNHLLSISINGKERIRNHYDARGNLTGSENLYGNGVTVKNDSAGRPEEITCADGSCMMLSYDERGNITELKDVHGGVTTYTYDALNRVVETKDANGSATRYAYDAADRITAVTDAMGNRREYTYNAGGKVTALKDFDGIEAAFSYNAIGKMETYRDKEGNEIHFAYDKMWNISAITAPDGGVQEYRYDKNNRLARQVLPMGGVVSYTYDAAGNRTGMTDPEGNTTHYVYDAADRLVQVKDATGAGTAYEYDRDGNLVKETDAAGHARCYTYDALGRRTSVTDAAGAVTSVCYNAMGKVERICYPNGSSTVYAYEPGGRLKSVRYPDGAGEDYRYDAKGNLTERTGMTGETWRFHYDCLDRIMAIENPAGGESRFVYDALGRVTEATDENGNRTHYEYSPNGNLTKVRDALGSETFYEYDAMGHLTRTVCTGVDGEEPQNTVYTWDKEGHVTAVTDPLGDVERYIYSPAGRMTAKVDRDGYETKYGYGVGGQVEEILYADGRKVSMTYSALRQLEEVKDWLGTIKITTDEAGRTVSVTDPYGKTVGYEWGSMGERTAVIYPDGRKVTYEYNEAMQLVAMQTGTGTITYAYDGAGRLTAKQLPGGSSTSYVYNDAGKIREILHRGADFTEQYRYEYDSRGNKILAEKERQGLTEDSGSFTYAYDALNRLTGVSRDGKVLREYGYDAFGNRSSRKEYTPEGEFVTDYRYNAKNQLVEETDENGTRDYVYDRRGNLLTVKNGEEILRAYGFDAANRMSTSMGVTDGTIKMAAYRYNGLGQRMEQSMGTGTPGQLDMAADFGPEQTIRYTLDLTRQYHNLLQKSSEAGREQTYYWDGNVTGMEEDGMEYFYFQDDLGSPVRLADGEGRSEEAYGYDEFGNDIRTGRDIFKDSLQAFGFTGYQMDEAGGLYYAQARRYDAGTGRFVSEDKMRGHIAAPYTLNHYSYCWNRPLDLVDLNGMIPTAGVTNELYDMGAELEENSDEIEIGMEWPNYGVDSALVSDLSGGIDISISALEDLVTSPQFYESEMKTFNNSVGIGTRANLVTSEVAGYKGILNNVSKISKVVGGAAVVLDVGINVYDNVQNGASTTEILSDATVDATIDIMSMVVAGAIAGSVVPVAGNLVGAIVGLIVGLVIYFSTDVLTINGKSIRDWAKEGFLNFINSTGGALEDVFDYVIEEINDTIINHIAVCNMEKE